jgi:hypothetical protein
VTAGTRQHAGILGECLEGLVLKLRVTSRETGVTSEHTEKYKFARYTLRTMLLRGQIHALQRDGQALSELVTAPGALEAAAEWARRW